ncbi:MAG: hypothetical protein ABJB95_09375, partial [Gemmatimonadales bacterium]
SDHSHEIRSYEITARGVVVGPALKEYDGIITGLPVLRAKSGSTVAKPAPRTPKRATAKRRR